MWNIDIDFVAYESRVIHFDRPDATVALFGEKSVGRASEMVGIFEFNCLLFFKQKLLQCCLSNGNDVCVVYGVVVDRE